MKTAVTVLQEMMAKSGQVPEYECINESGPKHAAVFEYRCKARGEMVSAIGRSKKEAKKESARLMLLKLAENGEPVPHPYNSCPPVPTGTSEEELRDDAPLRPDLGLKIADYHLSLKRNIEPEKCELASSVLSSFESEREKAEEASVMAALEAAAGALGLTVVASELPGVRGPLRLLELQPASPALVFAGATTREAASAALKYLQLALAQ